MAGGARAVDPSGVALFLGLFFGFTVTNEMGLLPAFYIDGGD
jgi:hypothetical protein